MNDPMTIARWRWRMSQHEAPPEPKVATDLTTPAGQRELRAAALTALQGLLASPSERVRLAAIKETLVLTQPFASAADAGPIKIDLSGMSDADLACMVQDLRDPGQLVSQAAVEIATNEELDQMKALLELVKGLEDRASAELPAFQPGVDRWPRRRA